LFASVLEGEKKRTATTTTRIKPRTRLIELFTCSGAFTHDVKLPAMAEFFPLFTRNLLCTTGALNSKLEAVRWRLIY
jgi:hypothetical protein